MSKRCWQLLLITVIAAFFTLAAVAQTALPIVVQAIPAGQRPMGIGFGAGDFQTMRVVVANSGENSVTILQSTAPVFTFPVQSSKVVAGIPAPFGVSELCSPVVVTSPFNNSVSLIDTINGVVKATIKVGSLPYSAECSGGTTAFVSSYGENTLSIVDLNTLMVTKTIPNVPGSRGFRGVAIDANGLVWVAGSDANVVTIVNPAASTIVTSIPVRAPSFVTTSGWVGSLADNSIYGFTQTGLTIASTISGIPTPQDFVPYTRIGQFATTGPGNSVAWIDANGVKTFTHGIPGVTGIIGGSGCVPRGPCGFALVTSPDSNQLFLIRVGPPAITPNDFQVSNGASFVRTEVAPGGLASAFATTGISQNFSATSVPLPKTLGGVTLRFGGSLTFDAAAGRWNYSPVGSLEAALLFVGPNQINFQLPPGISLGDSVPAQLTKPDGTTLLTTLQITATAPGIFTVLQNGIGQAAVLNENNSQNFGTNPAKRGSVIQIYATGAGETDPPLLPGEPAPVSGNPLFLTRAQPTVTIGGIEARVLFSGMAPGYVGLWQVNAEVPASVTPGPAVSLVMSAGGISSNTVTIAVE